ncbi:hypothetical protein C8R42DRAFT_650964, partial [Lentinula raphanica]
MRRPYVGCSHDSHSQGNTRHPTASGDIDGTRGVGRPGETRWFFAPNQFPCGALLSDISLCWPQVEGEEVDAPRVEARETRCQHRKLKGRHGLRLLTQN